jgi:hypothetical protein
MFPNKFIMKIYFITNLIYLFCIKNIIIFLYKFSQILIILLIDKRELHLLWTERVPVITPSIHLSP